jgi:hypothetical protein
MLETKFCSCLDKRKSGFTNTGTRKDPWWVCAGCLLPTRPYAESMLKKVRS